VLGELPRDHRIIYLVCLRHVAPLPGTVWLWMRTLIALAHAVKHNRIGVGYASGYAMLPAVAKQRKRLSEAAPAAAAKAYASEAYKLAAQAYGRALSRAFKQHLEQFREWGASGGKTRARKLTAEQRREGARKAARARWAKKPAK